MIGIYKIKNNINKKVYIGQSTNIGRRIISHKNSAFNSNYDCYEYPLYEDIRNFGIEYFSFEVLDICEKGNLNERLMKKGILLANMTLMVSKLKDLFIC